MRFSYAVASLALFAATTVQAYSTGSPVCKSDDATLGQIAKAGKMGKQADAKTFSNTWAFQLWDDQGKMVTGNSIMTNMNYWVTVTGGDFNGVMVYPMFDSQRIPTAKEKSVVSLTPGDKTFQIAAKCASTDGVTVTHTSGDSKDKTAKVAKVMVMDENAGKFMMSGVVVTAKSTFGKAVTPVYNLQAGTGDGGNNGTDNTGGDGTDNTGGDTGTGGGNDGTSPTDGTTDANVASSISFASPAVALVALAAFMLI